MSIIPFKSINIGMGGNRFIEIPNNLWELSASYYDTISDGVIFITVDNITSLTRNGDTVSYNALRKQFRRNTDVIIIDKGIYTIELWANNQTIGVLARQLTQTSSDWEEIQAQLDTKVQSVTSDYELVDNTDPMNPKILQDNTKVDNSSFTIDQARQDKNINANANNITALTTRVTTAETKLDTIDENANYTLPSEMVPTVGEVGQLLFKTSTGSAWGDVPNVNFTVQSRSLQVTSGANTAFIELPTLNTSTTTSNQTAMSFTAVDNIITDGMGRTTAFNLKTVTVPSVPASNFTGSTAVQNVIPTAISGGESLVINTSNLSDGTTSQQTIQFVSNSGTITITPTTSGNVTTISFDVH